MEAEAEGNAGQHCTHRAQYRISVSQALERIRQAIAVVTRGGNRMRESCKYGSVGGRPVMGVPTATRKCRLMAVRPKVRIIRWKQNSTRRVVHDPVADERLVRVTARAGAS